MGESSEGPLAARAADTLDDDVPTDPFPPIVPSIPPEARVRVFGSRAFFRLWLAQVVSSLGDWIGFVAVVALAQRIGGSSPEAAIALVMSARLIPGFFLSQFAGVLVDRWDRKKVMVCCDIGRGLVLATLPFIHTVWGLVLASLLLEIGTLFWAPAKEASVPNLVPADQLTTANSLSLVAAYGTFPIASFVFAMLTAVAGGLKELPGLGFLDVNRETLAIGVDVCTFFLSAVMIATLPLTKPRRDPLDTEKIGIGSVVHDLKEGWHFIFLNAKVRSGDDRPGHRAHRRRHGRAARPGLRGRGARLWCHGLRSAPHRARHRHGDRRRAALRVPEEAAEGDDLHRVGARRRASR